MKALLVLLTFIAIVSSSFSQSAITASEVLTKSIEYHDPADLWNTGKVSFRLFEARPGKSVDEGGNYRITDVEIDQSSGSFGLSQQRGPDLVERRVDGEACTHILNGETEVAPEKAKAMGLDCTQSMRMRDYYTYLWGMPMKLRDPGTLLDDGVVLTDFYGQSLLQVRVTYSEEVGSDIWYFYFHPETYALSGYRFYHDESANDGEYILLDGEANLQGLKLPRSRKWYMHKDDRYLGEDRIIFTR